MFKVKADFIGVFKTGDNIVRNFQTLEYLYRCYESANTHEKSLLHKPIILILVSIVEAVLQDFHVRIIGFTAEGVSSLEHAVIEYIRNKGNLLDKFAYILIRQKNIICWD